MNQVQMRRKRKILKVDVDKATIIFVSFCLIIIVFLVDTVYM